MIHLDLSDNVLSELSGYAFQHATSLQWLRLSGNIIKFIHKNAFFGLANLEWIDLSSNRLMRLNPGAFAGLVSLKELHLEDQKGAGLQQVRRERYKGKCSGVSRYMYI